MEIQFSLGKVLVSQLVLKMISEVDYSKALDRHQRGDWGMVSNEDAESNDEGLQMGERMMSKYKDTNGIRFYILTENDRSVTRVLLVDELESAMEIKFPLGQVVLTVGAKKTISMEEINSALHRHQRGDWGVVSEADAECNEEALEFDDQILSAYNNTEGIKFWIITEHDRSVTTVLLPEDY